MSFTLPALPYDYTALEPFVDSQTMNLHHTKHHQTYVTKLNEALGKEEASALRSLELESIVESVKEAPAAVQGALRNHGGGHWNHSFFWQVMAPVGKSNSNAFGSLKEAIEQSFGSVDAMKEKFNTAASNQFGSGWAWLSVDGEGKLFVSSTPNQDNPLMKGVVSQTGTPVLGLDVWEHAYYLKYQNRRPEYISAFWNIVNWDQVVKNFESAVSE